MLNQTDSANSTTKRSDRTAVVAAICFATLLASSGCTHRTLRPSRLPRHFVARPTENARTVDLSKLATKTTSDEIIVPGDVLDITIAAGLGADDTVELASRVDEAGFAELPQIGKVNLAGLRLDSAESAISTRSIQQGIYRAPHVTVTMKQPKMIQITVAGAVEEPGTYELRPGSSDLLHALVVAGSLTEDAGTNVEIRQPDIAVPGMSKAPLIAEQDSADGTTELVNHEVGSGESVETTGLESQNAININLASLERSRPNQYRLRDGAVVYVEQRDPAPISIGGLVRRADRYEYPVGENLYLLDAISMAGGESSPVADKVYVIREVDNQGSKDRGVIQISLSDAKHNEVDNILLMPGDVVTVEQTASTTLLEAIRAIGFNIGGAVF